MVCCDELWRLVKGCDKTVSPVSPPIPVSDWWGAEPAGGSIHIAGLSA